MENGIKYPFKVKMYQGRACFEPPPDKLKVFKGTELLRIGPETGEFSMLFNTTDDGYFKYRNAYQTAVLLKKNPKWKIKPGTKRAAIGLSSEWVDEDMEGLCIWRMPVLLPAAEDRRGKLMDMRRGPAYQRAVKVG